MDKLISVARLQRARGIKGELLSESLTSHPERLPKLKQVILSKGTKHQEFEVARVWFHDGRPVFQFVGIASMTDAESWVGAEVQIPAEEREPLPVGEYYFSDLIGCEVFYWLAAGVSGNRIGVVQDVEELPAGATLVVSDGKREMLIPLVKAICPEIDIPSRVIRSNPPEGLLDL